MTRWRRGWPATLALGLIALWLTAAPAVPQETVQVAVPGWVSFDVFDVGASTTGSPEPTRVEFAGAELLPGNVLRISVRAESAAFASPAGGGVPVGLVSWRGAGAAGGTPSDGTLDDVTYGVVFQGSPGVTAGSVDLVWTLAPPGAAIDAGTHQVELRWRFESVVP